MRRALTVLAFVPLILSAWDCVGPTTIAVQLWSRLRTRHRTAPDSGWDQFYAGITPLLAPAEPVGLVQVTREGTNARERQYYFLQYALTPRLVVPGPNEDAVIVYGPRSAAPALIDRTRFTEVKVFEDEFALFRRMR